ncbi:MAG TPA: prepilin-type N-terminal cleavage/methylation domain-containing protein [Pirellulaceae bacterium]|nr:prepilin-type N-terminal cleavage/methylation domain-containing protein [Pirellulaceae bacterium]
MRSVASRPPRGMTLVELLVVIGILVLLVAVAAPAMRPQLKDRKLREASRMLNTFIGGAKARAAETNSPVGIWILRDRANNRANSSYQVFMAETPLPFAGEELGDVGKATLSQPTPDGYASMVEFNDAQKLISNEPLRDQIQLDYRGPKYLLTLVDESAFPVRKFSLTPHPGFLLPRMRAPMTKVPFQVYRQPVRASGAPLELPPGTAIDLAYSGVGQSGVEMIGGTADIVIMFTPTGAIERVYGFGNASSIPGTIHFLIGRVDKLSELQDTPGDVATGNLGDPSNSWISIGHLTGTVSTAENYVLDPATTNVTSARTIAASKQTMGGR